MYDRSEGLVRDKHASMNKQTKKKKTTGGVFFCFIILAFRTTSRLWRHITLSAVPPRRVGSVAAPSSPLPPDSKSINKH